MAAKIKITQKVLDNRKLLQDYIGKSVSDPTREGLEIRIDAGGYVTFLLYARLPPKRVPTRKVIGTTKLNGKHQFMTLKEAKEKAGSLMSEVRRGANPFNRSVQEGARGPLLIDIVEKWISKELKGVTSADKTKVSTWPNWTRNKRDHYLNFIKFIESHAGKRPACLADFTHENAKRFLFDAVSQRTFKTKRSALSALHHFVVDDVFAKQPQLSDVYEMADENKVTSITRTFPKTNTKAFYRLTFRETNYMIDALHSKISTDPDNWLHYFALSLCIYNGLRISESVSLKTFDDGFGNYVDFRNDLIEFRDQKNEKMGSTPLLLNTRSVIEKVMETKGSTWRDSPFLFPQKNKLGHITVRKCGNLFNELRDVMAEEFSWTDQHRKGISQKKLRNTFATLQAEQKSGYSLEETSTILRHSSIEITRKYYIDPRAAVMSIDRNGGVQALDITEIG